MARTFNANNKYLKTTDAPGLNTSAGTIAFWFKPTWAYNDGVLHMLLCLNSGGNWIQFQKNSDNTFYLGWYVGAWYLASVDASAIVQNQWNLLLVTYKTAAPAASIAYLNNQVIGSGGCATWDTAASTMVVGQYTSESYTANADMAHLMAWSRVLTAAERYMLYYYAATQDPAGISNLLFHYPIDGSDPETDTEGYGADLNVYNAPATATDPADISHNPYVRVSKLTGAAIIQAYQDIRVSKLTAAAILEAATVTSRMLDRGPLRGVMRGIARGMF